MLPPKAPPEVAYGIRFPIARIFEPDDPPNETRSGRRTDLWFARPPGGAVEYIGNAKKLTYTIVVSYFTYNPSIHG